MTLNDIGYRELCDILVALKGELEKPNNGILSGRAVGFVRDQIQREHDYGASIFMSPKQMKWLRELYAEATGEDRPKDDRGNLEPVDERIERTTQRKQASGRPSNYDDDEIPF